METGNLGVQQLVFNKRETIEQLLFDHNPWLLHINISYPGIEMPESARGSHPTLTLQLGQGFAGEQALRSDVLCLELIIGGSFVSCKVPLNGVWGVTDGAGRIVTWPLDAPHPSLVFLLISSAEPPRATVPKEEKSNLGKKPGSQTALRRIK